MATKLSKCAYCSAINCSNSRKKCPSLSFYAFPKDKERCRIWVQNCRRDDLLGKHATELHKKGYFICEQHFEPSQFMNAQDSRKRLIWCAVPTIFAVPNPPPTVTPKRKAPIDRSKCAVPATIKKRKLNDQTSQDIDSTTDNQSLPSSSSSQTTSPRKAALKREKKRWQNRYYRTVNKSKCQKGTVSKKQSMNQDRVQLISDLSKYLSVAALKFVATQIRIGKKKWAWWSEEDKQIALSLFHTSPKAYKIFKLPSLSTLRRTMQKIHIFPGFCNNIFQALKIKVKAMSPSSVLCAVTFDEMAIKERVVYGVERDEIEGLEDFGVYGKTHFVANHATAFVLRGLVSRWKQTVGFFFTSGPINSDMLYKLLLDCLDKAEDCGLKVKIVVADQGSNNRKVFESLCGATKEQPFFMHKGSKVRLMYDPPHLLKNVRNNLKKTGFVINGEKISWSYIEEFYRLDKQSPVRIVPKLTDRHITLPPFAPLRVKLAAQILSHSVASGVSFFGAAWKATRGRQKKPHFSWSGLIGCLTLLIVQV